MDTRTLLAIADVSPAYYLSESRVFVSGVQLYPNKDCQNSATTTLQHYNDNNICTCIPTVLWSQCQSNFPIIPK